MISGIVAAMALVEVVTGAGVTNSVEMALSFEKGRAELRIPYDSLPKDVSSVRIKADFVRPDTGSTHTESSGRLRSGRRTCSIVRSAEPRCRSSA